MSTYQDELKISIDEKVSEKLKEMPDFSKKFFKHLENKGMSEKTILGYVYDLNTFFAYLEKNGFKKLKTSKASDVLDKLTIDDIQEYLDNFKYYEVSNKKKSYSMNSKARRVSSLRSFYRFYYRIGEIKNNLADLIDMPKIPEREIKAMDPEQVGRVLEVVMDLESLSKHQRNYKQATLKRDYAIMMLFLGTGVRVSELVGLDVDDIDLHNASLLVVRKGGDEDTVYFGNEVEQALIDYIKNEREEIAKKTNSPALFLSLQADRMSTRSIEKLVKDYAKRAEINFKVTPHTLRKTYGTNLYEETNDIYLVATALHHSSVETTKKFYTKIGESHKRTAAKHSSALFNK